jgi:very-short-patch-repair endonuclease
VRQSESGRRALVVCTADFVCGEPRTIVEADGSIRLR